MTPLNAASGWEETADNAGEVMADIEILWIIYTYTLYTKTETTDTRQDNCLAIGQFFFKDFP